MLNWRIGDMVEMNIPTHLRNGFVLTTGTVSSIDTDPSQTLLPVCFVTGDVTCVKTAMPPHAFRRVDS